MKNLFITQNITKSTLSSKCIYSVLALLLFFGTSLGCGPALKVGAPLIRDFTFTQQTAADPRLFCFSMEWRDTEGDLATKSRIGEIRLKVQDLSKPNSEPQATSPYKITHQLVAPGTQSGTISNICIAFRENTGEWPEKIKVYAQLIDSAGNESNQAWVLIGVQP